MTITAPTPAIGVQRTAAADAIGTDAAQSLPERTMATWTHWGPAIALAVGIVIWPAALLVLVIPVAMLVMAGLQSAIVREHASAAADFILTTLVGLGVMLGAVSILSIHPLITLSFVIAVLGYLGFFLVRAGRAAAGGMPPAFPVSLPILR
jgi:hypothetical protein